MERSQIVEVIFLRVFEQVRFAREVDNDPLVTEPMDHGQKEKADRIARRECLGDTGQGLECRLVVIDDFALDDGRVFDRLKLQGGLGRIWERAKGQGGASVDVGIAE